MTKEKLFEFAREKSWYEILKIAYETHSLSDIAAKLNKKESVLQVELRAMQSFNLLSLSRKVGGGYVYIPTVLGIKFMQELSEKEGKTFYCQLCGTTTGIPHVCPCFSPEFKE